MAYSSILGGEPAPSQPSGRGNDALGPSDNSDSGSDAIGTGEIRGDSDAVGTGERGAVAGPDAVEGADISPDRVVNMRGGSVEGADAQEFTDLDPDVDDDDTGELDADR